MPRPWTLARSLTSPTPRGRMMRGVLANVYDKGAVTLVQFLTIPLLTKFWGVEGYGVWLMLLTVPTYIALSDLGFGTAAGVVVTRSVVGGDFDTALNAIHSTIAFVLSAVSVASLVALGYAAWLAFHGASAGTFAPTEIALAVALITAYAFVVSQMSIVAVIYRGTHKFAHATVFAGTLMLVEGASLVLVVVSGGGIALAALAYFIVRSVGYFLFVRLLKLREPWVEIGIKRATWHTIRTLANPSAAALGLTLATALLLQGMILALGATAGAATVAVFGASRTLCRAPLQLSGMFLRPSIPELTRAITSGNKALERRLTKANISAAIGATVPFSLVLVFYGQDLLGWISHGALVAPNILFVILSSASVLNATWMALAAPLIAMNRQAEFSYWYLALAALGVACVFGVDGPSAVWVGTLMALVEASLFIGLIGLLVRKKDGL